MFRKIKPGLFNFILRATPIAKVIQTGRAATCTPREENIFSPSKFIAQCPPGLEFWSFVSLRCVL